MAGFRCFQSPSRLVTEMKSEPKKTRLTSGMVKSALARGHRALAHHLAARQEFEGGGIGGGFGLDEHGARPECLWSRHEALHLLRVRGRSYPL